MNVLIVEDEQQIACFIKMELEHEGYMALIAIDGREAIEKVKTIQFDIILLDIMIPFINGIEVCKRIREFSNIPIIMLTAKEDISDKVIGLDSGANDYITKPFDIEELFARMRVVTRVQNVEQTKKLTADGIVMDIETHEIICNDKKVELTKKSLMCLNNFSVIKEL
ncbi:response regulator transcription factor [Clostridium sp. UBA1652]|uniref:response regulator transcription factor n=1 Tax=Clostridium sp. UBA1652 TaxID=1946348 RepID=UPI0032E4FFF9